MPLILFHQSKFTETRVIFWDKQIRLRDFSTKLRQFDVIVWDPGKYRPAKGNALRPRRFNLLGYVPLAKFQ